MFLTKEGLSLAELEPFPEYIYTEVPASSELIVVLKNSVVVRKMTFMVPSTQVVEVFGLLGVYLICSITRCVKERAKFYTMTGVILTMSLIQLQVSTNT